MTTQQDIFSSLPEPKTGPPLYAIIGEYVTANDGQSKTANGLGWGIYFVTDKARAEFCRSVFPLPLSLAKKLYKPKYIKGGYRAGSSVFEELPRELWRRKTRRPEIADGGDNYKLDDMENLAKIIQSGGKL